METINPIERELFHEEKESVSKLKLSVSNTLPRVQAVCDAYEPYSAYVELTDEVFHKIFSDLPSLITEIKEQWYAVNFKEKHEHIGISFDTGIALVSDKIPDFSDLSRLATDFFDSLLKFDVVGNEFFSYADGEVVINVDFLNKSLDGYRIYLETPGDFEIVEVLENLSNSLVKLDRLAKHGLFNLWQGGRVNYSDLMKVFDSIPPTFGEGSLKINISFLRQFKITQSQGEL